MNTTPFPGSDAARALAALDVDTPAARRAIDALSPSAVDMATGRRGFTAGIEAAAAAGLVSLQPPHAAATLPDPPHLDAPVLFPVR